MAERKFCVPGSLRTSGKAFRTVRLYHSDRLQGLMRPGSDSGRFRQRSAQFPGLPGDLSPPADQSSQRVRKGLTFLKNGKLTAGSDGE